MNIIELNQIIRQLEKENLPGNNDLIKFYRSKKVELSTVISEKINRTLAIQDNWFYIFCGKIYGNKITSLNDRINNKQIIVNELLIRSNL